MKTFLTALVLFVAICVGEAQAGRNLWTYRVYLARPSDGCLVKCSGGSCAHGCDRRMVTKHGIRYRVRTRVVPAAKGGLDVKVTVRVRVMDGQTHGVDDSLALDGRLYGLPPYAPGEGEDGLRLMLRGWSHPPKLAPGKTLIIRESYGENPGIKPGHRLVLNVRMYWVKHPGWPKSTKPRLATVVLTVPYRGQPRVRIY